MSKTKGNTVDPLGMIDELGADALRFAVVHGTTPGNDQRFGPAKVENARNFANKLWNATRFVLGARPASIPVDAERRLPDAAHLGPADRWVLSRAAATTAAVDRAMADYNFGEVTRLLYEAIWSEYCDWGLELAKVRLADTTLPDAEREATWWALVEALDTYLRLLHPVMPFITERLWQALPHRANDPELLIVARVAGRRRARRGRRGRTSALSSSSCAACATPAPTRRWSPAPGCRWTSTWIGTSGTRSRRCGRPSSGSPGLARCAAT